MKFKNCQEMYDAIQACHGGNYWEDEDGYEWSYEELMSEIFSTEGAEGPAATFGTWNSDVYETVHHGFCDEYTHENSIDGKTYSFYFYEDESDTAETDGVFGSVDDALDAAIDYGFLNALAKILGQDPIK